MDDSKVHRDLRPLYSEVHEAMRDLESAERKAVRLGLDGTADEIKSALSLIRSVKWEIEECDLHEFAKYRVAEKRGG